MNPRYLRYRLPRWHTEPDTRALIADCHAAGVKIIAVRRLHLGPIATPDFGAITDSTQHYFKTKQEPEQ